MLTWMLALTMTTTNMESPKLDREFRGVWVATVANIDWPSTRNLTVPQQKAELKAIVERAAELNFNAIIFQIRPCADALYPSKLEPWSEWLTGKPGVGPDPMWDPLQFVIEESHKHGIELHAWFNPYRAWHAKSPGKPSSGHISRTHPGSVREYGGYLWMDPSDAFVQKRTREVMMDVVKRYDLDGIHIDDYFYPYPVKGKDGKLEPFPDAANYKKYRDKGGKMALNDWRRDQVDSVIQGIYSDLKKTKKWVRFGISPFGIWRPGYPKGIEAGLDQYDQLYADARKWLREGWCDYFTPQLYWQIARKAQSYPALLEWWLGENPKGRHVWPGSYTGQIMENWPAQEILDQIRINRQQKAGGVVHFSMKIFMQNSKNVNDALLRGPYSEYVLPPSCDWLAGAMPKLKVSKVSQANQGCTIAFQVDKPASARFVVVASGDRIIARSSAKLGEIQISPQEWANCDVQSLKLALTDTAGRLGPWQKVALGK